jgi:hypothetical protein
MAQAIRYLGYTAQYNAHGFDFIGSVFINAYLGLQRTNAISWVIRCKEI